VRARAGRLAVPGRVAQDRADFQAAREDQAAGQVERDRAGQDLADQDEDRDRAAVLERPEVAVEKLRAKVEEAGTAADLTHRAAGGMRRRACVEQAGLREAVWVRWRLKPG
jgi:hypothetical protein